MEYLAQFYHELKWIILVIVVLLLGSYHLEQYWKIQRKKHGWTNKDDEATRH